MGSDRDRYARRSRSRSRDGGSRRRSRSRSRDRSSRRRSRTRSRSRERSHRPVAAQAPAPAMAMDPNPQLTAMQTMAAIQQQQQLQRQLLAQQLLLQNSAASGQTALQANRKQREVYVGNLAIGSVTADMLKELFNAVLAQMVQDPISNPPVMETKLDASGRFGFVELRTIELADAAVQLDKLELCGRPMNVGRPKGYAEPPPTMAANAAKLNMAQMFAAQLSGAPAPVIMPAPMLPQLPMQALMVPTMLPPPPLMATNVVLLENLMPVGQIRGETEKAEVRTGTWEAGAWLLEHHKDACRAYVRFSGAEAAGKCRAMMDGRMFDVNKVKATFVSESDFARAQAGEWIAPAAVGMPSGMMGGMMGGMPGYGLPGYPAYPPQ
ncbi:MAG: hypothetical protein WDW38_004034 [Sanguina aurantia]